MSEVESSTSAENEAAAESSPPPDELTEPAAADAAQPNGGAPEAQEQPSQEAPEPAPAEPAAVEVTPDDERPLVGPKIIGMAPPERPPAPVKRLARPRRRRPTAADKHRRLFFQKLNEMRREGRPSDDEPVAAPEATAEEVVAEEVVAEEPVAEEPVAEEPVAEEPVAEEVIAEEPVEEAEAEASVEEPVAEAQPAAERGPARQPRRGTPPLDAKARARLAVAIERVGGAEIIQAALVPKHGEEGAPKRWALVCCEAAEGTPPGDPVYVAWLRLASTPVREVKLALRALAPERESRGRGGRGERGARSGGPPRDRGDQPRGGGGGGRGGPRGDRPAREDRGERLAPGIGIDGSFTTKVRIVTDDADERAERDRLRKEEREAKRRAAQERLDRLGF